MSSQAQLCEGLNTEVGADMHLDRGDSLAHAQTSGRSQCATRMCESRSTPSLPSPLPFTPSGASSLHGAVMVGIV